MVDSLHILHFVVNLGGSELKEAFVQWPRVADQTDRARKR